MRLYGVGSISADYHNELPLLGCKWKACDHSIGLFGPTNHIENLWSVIKRALRYIYRDLTFNLNVLELILRELKKIDIIIQIYSIMKITT